MIVIKSMRKLHQFIDEKIVGAEARSVRKVERRSVDRDTNMGLERNRNLSDTTSSSREPTDILCKLLQQQAAPEVDIEYFDDNPLNYHYFMALFSEVVETKIDDPRGRLTRLIKYAVGVQWIVVHADCKIARWTDGQMEQKGAGNQKGALT